MMMLIRYVKRYLQKEQLIEPANINSPGQIVVSGHKSLIDELVKKGQRTWC